MRDWQFYVYLHRRADDASIFYVGKGKKSRAWRTNRNPLWSSIAGKHGFYVEVIFYGTEDACFSLERDIIGLTRQSGGRLANLTDGGEGLSNPSASVRAKKSASMRAIWRDEVARSRRIKALTLAAQSPDVRARRSKMSSLAMADPEVRKKISESLARRWKDQGLRRAVSELHKKLNENPEYRAMVRRRTIEAISSPCVREKISKSVKEAFACPAIKARQANRMRVRNDAENPMAGIDLRGASYRARIKDGQKNITIGSFGSLADAQAARRKAEAVYWGLVP